MYCGENKYRFHLLFLIGGLVSLFLCPSAQALNSNLQKTVYYETNANGAAKKSDQAVKVYHYEIPLSLLEEDKAPRVPPEIYRSLVFERDGKKYVRWIINPEDTEWHLQIKKYLEDHNIPAMKRSYFVGYPTASRSWIIEDPNSGAVFSAKTSTNRLAKKEAFKNQPWADTRETRRALDYISERNKISPFENFRIMDEPLAFGIPRVDQGIIIRTLADAPKNEFIYLPAFSAIHQLEGKKIAQANGIADAEKFWNEHLNKPLARAAAELYAKTGVIMDSTHSQNFLIELDKNLKPTGKVILKDLGDINVHVPTAQALDAGEFLKKWPSTHKLYNNVSFGIGLLHFNKAPSWLSKSKYKQWGKDYFQEFEKELSKRTGIKNFAGEMSLSEDSYHSKLYNTEAEEWKSFRRTMLKEGSVKIPSCEKTYSNLSGSQKVKSH